MYAVNYFIYICVPVVYFLLNAIKMLKSMADTALTSLALTLCHCGSYCNLGNKAIPCAN